MFWSCCSGILHVCDDAGDGFGVYVSAVGAGGVGLPCTAGGDHVGNVGGGFRVTKYPAFKTRLAAVDSMYPRLKQALRSRQLAGTTSPWNVWYLVQYTR